MAKVAANIDSSKQPAKRILENSYHGLIKENETFVEITPLIKVDETKICGFHIIKKNKEIPFQPTGSLI
uniref:Uncharacterized protein n=1 Tax=Anopheles quadriannulatus TaxID=34691 RepID=A0A182WWW9_ANOQN